MKLEDLIAPIALEDALPVAEQMGVAIYHATCRVMVERGLIDDETAEVSKVAPRLLAAVYFWTAVCDAYGIEPSEAFVALLPLATSPGRAGVREDDIGTRREQYATLQVNPFNKH